MWWTTAQVVAVKDSERGGAPAGSADIFVQWKGTDVCFDFTCGECGGEGHFDGFFAYAVRCPHCGALYVMPATVYALHVRTAYHEPVVPERPWEDASFDQGGELLPEREVTPVDRALWEIRNVVGPARPLTEQQCDHLRNRVDAVLQLYDRERRASSPPAPGG
jgi:hypothetical protein